MQNLLGQKFGKLTIIQKLENAKWKCVCDCGNKVVASENDLISGNVIGCGCKHTPLESIVPNSRVYLEDEPNFSGLKKYFDDDETDFSGLKDE